MDIALIGINETRSRTRDPEVFAALLRCQSSWHHANRPEGKETDFNIIWATNDYESLGSGYGFGDRITPDLVTGKERETIIRPRVLKNKEVKERRTKNKAEVFTPSWVCNAQNNLVDEAWFGRPDVFNSMDMTTHIWEPSYDKIEFPEDKSWQDYVCALRLEMCCGEAPYLASRYDTVSGEPIAVERRMGLLDRKLRVVSENVKSPEEWIKWAFNALKATYGFEWQGDSLLLARESILHTVYDFYEFYFGEEFPVEERKYLAYIISWNLFQMDGLKLVVPESCHDIEKAPNLFGVPEYVPCPGCKKGTRTGHNGIPSLVAEWSFDTSHKSNPFHAEPFHLLLKKKI